MPGTDRRQNGPLATTLDTFVPRIAAAADAIDDARQLPPQLAAAMADAGLFRLLLPLDLEGSDTPYPAYLRAVQTIAQADASTAWCVNQGCVFATLERALSDGTRRAIWDDPRGVIANGPPIEAAAEPREGGHVLTGRWWFSSGLPHATWLAALAPWRMEQTARRDCFCCRRPTRICPIPARGGAARDRQSRVPGLAAVCASRTEFRVGRAPPAGPAAARDSHVVAIRRRLCRRRLGRGARGLGLCLDAGRR